MTAGLPIGVAFLLFDGACTELTWRNADPAGIADRVFELGSNGEPSLAAQLDGKLRLGRPQCRVSKRLAFFSDEWLIFEAICDQAIDAGMMGLRI